MSSSTYEGTSKYTGEAESSQQRGGSKQQPESSTAQDGKMGKEKKNKKGGNSSATRVSGNLLQKQLFSVDTSICFYAFANEMRFIQ